MSTEDSGPSLEERTNRLRNKLDNYLGTVEAVFAFGHESLWNPSAKRIAADGLFQVGPCLAPQEGPKLTPDRLVSRAGYRAVAEVKATYPSREEQLDEIRKQVKKYDQPLVGWPVSGSQPESHDVVLLTHHSRKAHFADFFSSWTVENGAEFNSPFCVVGFARVDQSGKFISLELQSGRMSDQGLRDRLHRAVYVAMHHLIINYVLVFYDADPPLPYVMAFLWMKVFADILSVEDYIAGREGAEPPTLTVNVRDLTERARAICRPSASWARMPELPRTEWIRDAMDGFVQLGYARKVAEDDAYAVPYKFIRDPQEEFTRKAAAAEQRAEGAARRPSRRAKPRPGPEQLSLFELDE